MASSTPFDGTSFLTGAPDIDQPHGNDYQEHQSTKKSLEFINNKEHVAIGANPSIADAGGEHKLGSARAYRGDYSAASAGDALPTLRPDGVTALDASDAGRLAIDTDATFGGITYEWSGSAWAAIPYTTDTETTLAGKTWFLDEDDMASDDETKVASQQSVKKYVDDNIGSANWTPTAMSGVSDSIGTVTMPNGLIMKWGKVTRTGTDTPVSFAVAFPDACFQAFPVSGTNANIGEPPGSYGISASGFTIQQSNTADTTLRWFAIGR